MGGGRREVIVSNSNGNWNKITHKKSFFSLLYLLQLLYTVWQFVSVLLLNSLFFSFSSFLTNAIPCFSLRIVYAIDAVWHEFYCILKANLCGNSFKKINTKSLEPIIAGEIAFLYHQIRLFFTCHYSKLATRYRRGEKRKKTERRNLK